jgi:hypothetical protein
MFSMYWKYRENVLLLQNKGHIELYCIATASTLLHFRALSNSLKQYKARKASYYSMCVLA